MDKPPSYSVAPGDRGRDRILPRGGVLGLVGIAVIGLVLVFPKRDLLTLLRQESELGNRDLTIAYLRNIIRTEPRDLNLRLLLAEKLIAAGELDEARQALGQAQALLGGDAAAQARWAEWDLAWWRARYRQVAATGQPADMAAAEVLQRLRGQIAAVDRPARVFALVGTLHELQPEPPQARQLVAGLLQSLLRMPSAGLGDLTQGARLALAEGALPQAADLFFAARGRTAQTDARQRLLEQGVQALLAAGQPVQAYQAAARESAPLPSGDPYHWTLASLALGAALPREAAAHLRQVLPPSMSAAALAASLSPQQLRTAYDTFAAASDLPQALRMAEAGRLQQPGDAGWLERYAQVSEWSGRGPQALAAWVQLMQRGASERALDNVFRLSPMLYDDDALLAAWLALQRRRPLSDDETRRVVAVYERLGNVDGALAFLRRLIETQPGTQRGLLSQQAALLERAGRPREAIAVLEALRPAGLARDDAMRLAQLHLKQGDQPAALRALQARLPDEAGQAFDADYWNLLADLAWETGERAASWRALDEVIARGAPKPYQAERAVRLRLEAGDAPAARALAARLYPRTPSDELVFAWLDAIDAQPDTAELQQLLAALQAPHRARLEQNTAFLERRAGLHVRLGELASAARDYRQALALRPDLAAARVAYWWLLIDQQDDAALRAELGRHLGRVRHNAAYREVLAAAMQQLDQPRQALALMLPQAPAHADDFLWLMNYADVLERAQQGSVALRVRRHAWGLANRAAAQPADAAQARQALMTQLRLAAAFAGGTQKQRWQQQLGALLAAPQADAESRRQLDDLAAAWLLSAGRFDAAARWLWRQQAARIETPAYQQAALALANGDLQQLDRLLDRPAPARGRGAQRLDIQDEITALRELDRVPQAAAAGVTLGQRLPEGLDDDTQQAVQEDLLRSSSNAGVQSLYRTTGGLARSGVGAQVERVLGPGLRLTVELTSLDNRVTDASQIAAVPAHDREARLGLQAKTAWGEVVAEVFARDALASFQGGRLQLTRKLDSRSTLILQAARNDRTDDSAPLSVAGMRDRLAASLGYRLSKEAELEASVAGSRYRTQTGAYLGRGVDAALTGNWYVRRDYPDIRLQASLRRSHVRSDGQPDAPALFLIPPGTAPSASFFLGQDATAFSATVGVGLSQSDPAVYSQAWRPYGEIGFDTRWGAAGQSTQGLLRLGAKGAVAGRDQLSINLDIRPSPPGQPSSAGLRELRLQYQIFFDR
ncbi:tetratricopeptide repeat protein [Variovorax terrae]|uniref:Tetratricopeptide repeat protein n=1 Tax=Variovorax terrae TaxID=2923278 RepID=A0A9X1VY16_9BURK|nr:tetratricopeptide repeat protein [Variovorax terrae]MCJ0765430.1 tetratricopeptide repeat protein [Variovorax terrae]